MEEINKNELSEVNTATPPMWQHFSKQTLLLIAALLVITGGLLYLAIRQETPRQSSPVMMPSPTPNPAHTTLSLVQQSGSSSANQVAALMIDSHQNLTTGVQVNLSYDPNVISNITILPGTYFPNPVILLNNVDKVNGRISYVLAIQPTQQQASGSGTVATISYTLLPTANPTTNISFLPKSEVTQQGILGTVLKSTTDLTIQVPQTLLISPTSHY